MKPHTGIIIKEGESLGAKERLKGVAVLMGVQRKENLVASWDPET